jgi:hypothetical protein
LCRTVAISNHVRAGWRRADGTLKIIFTVHTSDLLFIAIEDSTRSRTGDRVIFTQNDVRNFGRNRREFYAGSQRRFGRQNDSQAASNGRPKMFTMSSPLQPRSAPYFCRFPFNGSASANYSEIN